MVIVIMVVMVMFVCASNYGFKQNEEELTLKFFMDLFIKDDKKEAFKKHIIDTYSEKNAVILILILIKQKMK